MIIETLNKNTVQLINLENNKFNSNLIDYLNFTNDFRGKFSILKLSTKNNITIEFDDNLQVRKFKSLFKLF